MRETLRQAFHVVYGLLLAGLLVSLGSLLTAGIISILLALGFLLQRVAAKNRHLIAILKVFGRPEEKTPGEGAVLFTLGCGLAVIFFPKWVALASILVLTLADAASTLFGRLHGSHKISGKSLEGALAFLVVAVLTLMGLGLAALLAAGTALIATIVEAVVPLDDNVTVPLVVGLLLL